MVVGAAERAIGRATADDLARPHGDGGSRRARAVRNGSARVDERAKQEVDVDDDRGVGARRRDLVDRGRFFRSARAWPSDTTMRSRSSRSRSTNPSAAVGRGGGDERDRSRAEASSAEQRVPRVGPPVPGRRPPHQGRTVAARGLARESPRLLLVVPSCLGLRRRHPLDRGQLPVVSGRVTWPSATRGGWRRNATRGCSTPA